MAKKTEKKESGALRGEVKTVKIGDVRPNNFNYNKQSGFVFEKTVESIKTYGFVDPLVARTSNEKGKLGYFEIIGGEHRLKAAEALGLTSIPVVDLGMVSDRDARKLCIVLNETRGKADADALNSLIAELSNAGMEDLTVLPYDESELQAMIDAANAGSPDSDEPEPDEDVPGNPTDKKTLVSIMGLLDITKKKEEFLISQFERAMILMGVKGKPVRCLEKMFDLVEEAYGPEKK